MSPRRFPRILAVTALAALAACGGGGSGSADGETRTVLVDYNHDEFAAAFLEMYPRNVTVHPGDTVVFKQEWTGEPHTVTMGKLFDDLSKISPELRKWLKEGGPDPFETLSPEVQSAVEERFNQLPFALGEGYEASQNTAQACYLDDEPPPSDPDTPCPDREQPAFNGRQAYYSSGIIPYEGNDGNRFEVPLADDIAPGDYAYYCAVHGPGQSGVITVVDEATDIPSQAEVSRQAQEEINKTLAEIEKGFRAAERGSLTVETGGESQTFTGDLAGFFAPKVDEVHAFGLEFVPRTIQAKVGEKVSWTVLGGHTISFDVPRYLPIVTFADDGTVEVNPKVTRPQGGWPGQLPEEGAEEEEEGDEEAPPDGEADEAPPEGSEEGAQEEGEDEGGIPEFEELDAGRWNGNGFVSSGVIADVKYSVVFTKAGTYKYACLIHPKMVGEVKVT
jgi:plastocyanin